jgi:GDPmannose 4,6-dehydratase
MKKAIITGISGQDGAYLAELLLKKNYQVFGLTRSLQTLSPRNLHYLGIADQVHLLETDLLDPKAVNWLIGNLQPDEIYNLAAQSSVGLSYQQPITTLHYNLLSVAHLLEAVRLQSPKTRFYQASSSEMFGNIRPENLPIHEDLLFHPVSPYAVSKASAHWMTVNYREAFGLHTCCGILFNHESPLRGENFVIKKVVNAAVKIKMGIHPTGKLELGNLSVSRDFGYAPAYVEAMWRMMQPEKPDDYLICSGQAVQLKDFVRKVFEQLDLHIEDHVQINESLLRPVELEIIYGDNTKAHTQLGWEYNLSPDQLIHRLLEEEEKWIKYEL